jgi:hypothetical protein
MRHWVILSSNQSRFIDEFHFAAMMFQGCCNPAAANACFEQIRISGHHQGREIARLAILKKTYKFALGGVYWMVVSGNGFYAGQNEC